MILKEYFIFNFSNIMSHRVCHNFEITYELWIWKPTTFVWIVSSINGPKMFYYEMSTKNVDNVA